MASIVMASHASRLACRTTTRHSLNNTAKFIGRRSMATASRKEFLCILLDRPNVLEIRKKVKGVHYEGVKPLVASGRLVVGGKPFQSLLTSEPILTYAHLGAMFDKHPIEGGPAPFKGSMIVYSAETVEEVRDIISQDIYATSGVWDLEKVQIIPTTAVVCVCGTRTYDLSFDANGS
ncbi:Fc.00g045960.m01.CDS01 [Cosmosporella sp. VM-42]